MRSIARRLTALALVVLPGALSAQTVAGGPPGRSPIWATLSAGRGDLQVNCGICRGTDQSSWAADVALGGWLNTRTTLGGELGAWRLGGDDATQRVMMVSVMSQLYPMPKVPGFVKLGLG